MQVGRSTLVAKAPSLGRCPPRVAERRRKLGAERHVVGAAAPLEVVHGAASPRRRRRGWRPSAAALGRRARAARLGDRLYDCRRRQRVDERLLTTSCKIKQMKAIVDIRLRPRCAISPHSRSIVDSSNACDQSSTLIVCMSLHGRVQFAVHRMLGLSGTCFSPKLPLPLQGSSPHVTHRSSVQEAHSSFQTASRSVQLFLYGSQMLCCTMHYQWGR